jgi:hypothetical protein
MNRNHYTPDELREIATSMRAPLAGMQSDMDRMLSVAAKFEAAADGRVSEAELQAAIDEANATTPSMEELWDRMDAALNADNPLAWAEVAAQMLPLLTEPEARIWMEALHTGLLANATEAAGYLVEMNPQEMARC